MRIPASHALRRRHPAIAACAVTAALLAQPAPAQDFPESLPQAAWFKQFQQELRAAWVPPNVAGGGPVRFVVGNDRVQPGGQFKNGSPWLALACTATECRLLPATLSVKDRRAAGGRSGQRLHFEVAEAADTRVVAWFAADKAPAWLAAGAVPSYYTGGGRPRETGRGTDEALIDLPGGGTATLLPMLVGYPDPSRPLPPALLQLRGQGKRQLLLGQLGLCSHTFKSEDYLLWAGDIDRDGEADFLVSFVDGDGPIHLYLSSAAKPQQPAGLAGVYNTPPTDAKCGADEDAGGQ
jgi:hypothetical protein